MNLHEKYMQAAINLAKRGRGMTTPNPLVGAVVVKNRRIIGRGYHKRAGMPHAEIYAIGQAGLSSKDAALYVTLEPCDHYGRTPPCTDAIIKSGIRKVVVAMKDPNPINDGRGMKKLKMHGVSVIEGILKNEALSINKPYIKFVTKKLPYVTVKIASSLDGKIATTKGESKWISNDESRHYVRRLRNEADAVMVGVNTVINDDPTLMANSSLRKQPARIVVDSHLKTPLNAKVFSNIDISSVIVVTIRNDHRIARYEAKGAQVLIAKSKDGRVDLKDMLKKLAEKDVTRILVEGGGELIGSLVDEELVDEFLFFFSPKIIGGRNAITSVEGVGVSKLRDAHILKNIRIKRFSEDILIECEVYPVRKDGGFLTG